MPRAAFSQIVNRSMSEVLTRSLATTSCTLMPILALLLFGGATLKDFAFALLIGVASGAYSSIFIASPVLTHWKERESHYRARRARIEEEHGGLVPAYADGGDVDPVTKTPRRPGRITQPDAETVSAAEFEQMKRELGIEHEQPGRHTSTLTRRLAHRDETDTPPAPAPRSRSRQRPAKRAAEPPTPAVPPAPAAPATPAAPAADQAASPPAPASGPTTPAAPVPTPPPSRVVPPPAGADNGGADSDGLAPPPAPDIAENDGISPVQKPKPAAKPRNRRHGRRR
jgi:hypothetical protein